MKKIIQKGFTLAEVLITLAILGVVAAVTLPNMVQDTKYQQLGVELSKFVSTLENTATAYAVGNGGTIETPEDVEEMANNTLIYKNKNIRTGVVEFILKDGSFVGFNLAQDTTGFEYALNSQSDASKSQIGSAFIGVTYNPNVKGTVRPGNETYWFALTTKGYVLPAEECTQFLYSNNFKFNKSEFETNCN